MEAKKLTFGPQNVFSQAERSSAWMDQPALQSGHFGVSFLYCLELRDINAKLYVDELTPSLLAKALRGELAQQDPNDEPSAVMFARHVAKPDRPDRKNRQIAK